MDLADVRMVLCPIVDDLYARYFPELKQDSKNHSLILGIYADFVSDRFGYWIAVKTTLLIKSHLNLREEKATPLHTAQAIVEWAIKDLEAVTIEHQNDNGFITMPLPEPEVHRFFQSSDIPAK